MTGSRPAEAVQHALLHPVLEESQRLDTRVRTQMERSLGATFGDVVVHAGAASGALAETYDAAAFTVGRHVVFGPGRFDPSSARGRTLIAHELGHVVEQRRGGGDPELGARMPAGVIPLHAGHSEGAGRTAAQAALGNTASVTGATGVGVARQTKQEERASLATAPAMTEAMTRPREASAPAAPSLQLPSGDARTVSQTLMRAIEGLTARPDGAYTTTYLGQTLVMTAEDAEKARAAASNSLVDVAARSRRRFEGAMGRYKAQEEVDDEFWLSSKAAHAAAWIGTGGEHQDPWLALVGEQPAVVLGELTVQRLVAEGRLASAAAEASRSELASGRSAALVQVYVDQTIEGAQEMATGLEFTRDAAFVTLGVLAVVVTAGAAAGLAPGVVGAGIGGMSLGTTVTMISVGAPLVATVGPAFAKLAEGDPVDWGDVAVDVAVQVVLAKFGGKLGQKVFGKLAGNPATRTAVRRVLASVGSGVVTHEASQVFIETVEQTHKALKGDEVTWDGFVDKLAERMTNPSGIFMAAAMSGFQVAAHGAFDKAAAMKTASSNGGSSKPPPPPSSKPPAAPIQEPAAPVKTPVAPTQKSAATKPEPVPEQTTPAKPAVTPTQKPATSPAPAAKAKTKAAASTPPATKQSGETAPQQVKAATPKATTTTAKPKAAAEPKKQGVGEAKAELKNLSARAAALRKRAVTDPGAVDELEVLYGKASDRALAKMEKSDPVAAKVLARRRARNEEAAKIRSDEKEVPRAPHEATVIVTNDDGRTVLMAAEGVPRTPGGPIPLGPARRELKSGGTSTPERRKQIGMNRANQESHTEAKAVQLPLRKGQTMTILGQYDPCSSCRGYMQRKATASGGTVVYVWMGGQETFTPGGTP